MGQITSSGKSWTDYRNPFPLPTNFEDGTARRSDKKNLSAGVSTLNTKFYADIEDFFFI